MLESKRNIVLGELRFSASKGSGPGGQSVNKTNSRVTLNWNLEDSALGEYDKERIRNKLSEYVYKSGVIGLSSHSSRSQYQNKAELIERLFGLIDNAFKEQKKRVPTRRTLASSKRRLKAKKIRTDIKKLRRKLDDD